LLFLERKQRTRKKGENVPALCRRNTAPDREQLLAFVFKEKARGSC
jgi:hypothetical protein